MSGSTDSQETLTFLVRLWRETAAGGLDHWRGRVEHVASQEVGYVEGCGRGDALHRAVDRHCGRRGPDRTSHPWVRTCGGQESKVQARIGQV